MADDARQPGEAAATASPGSDLPDEVEEERESQRALKPIGAVVLMALGGFAVVSGIGFDIGSLDRPGPGLWPAALGGALVLATLAFVVFNRDGKEGAFGSELWNAGLVIASIVAFILLFEHVSFFVASAVLLLGTQLAAGARRWWAIALTCVLGTGGAWLLFFVLLGVSTPL